MRKLKIKLWQPNYFCIGNTHLFVNFSKSNLDYMKELNPESVHTIHVFITTHAAINDSLRMLIRNFGKFKIDLLSTGKKYPKIIIHLPYPLRELKKLTEEFLGSRFRWKLIVERKGPSFNIIKDSYWLNFDYDKKWLRVNTIGKRTSCPVSLSFFEYPYEDTKGDNNPGIFETPEMRLNPELFKDKLIEAFKRDCPPGIVKSFKTDDDIFEYIMQRGEWSTKEERK